MRRSFCFLFFCFLLAACSSPVGTQPGSTSIPTPSGMVTSVAPSPTQTAVLPSIVAPLSTETPAPSTVTPLPAIPTFTPTFDVRTIVTATPAPKAQCSQITPVTNQDLALLNVSYEHEEDRQNVEQNLSNFLSKFGLASLYKALKQTKWVEGEDYLYRDLTNDGLPEIAVRTNGFSIIGCSNGRYKTLLTFPFDGHGRDPSIEAVIDGNRNGIPELLLLPATYTQGGRDYYVYEWNGEKFTNLTLTYPNYSDSGINLFGTGTLHFEDVDHDTVQELIVDSGMPYLRFQPQSVPLRNERTYYKWNGAKYVPAKIEFAPPEFRFQAVQDADLALRQNEYDKALDLYQQAIFNTKLKIYSPEIHRNLVAAEDSDFINASPTPPPTDPTEYPRLAAYAYYRMVMLHTFLGQTDAAQIKYATLQEKFPAGSPGHPYVEMAMAFWNAYQSGQKIVDGCAAAIAYTAVHPETLVPLGSDYHGDQSYRYTPADMCPFR